MIEQRTIIISIIFIVHIVAANMQIYIFNISVLVKLVKHILYNLKLIFSLSVIQKIVDSMIEQ